MNKTILQLKVDFFKMMMQYIIDTNNKQLLADWLDFLEISNENISDKEIENIVKVNWMWSDICETFGELINEED